MRRKEDLGVKEKWREKRKEDAVERKVFGGCVSKFQAFFLLGLLLKVLCH